MPIIEQPISYLFERYRAQARNTQGYLQNTLALTKTEHICFAISEHINVVNGADWFLPLSNINTATLVSFGRNEYDNNQYDLSADVNGFMAELSILKSVVDQFAVVGSQVELSPADAAAVDAAINAVLALYVSITTV